MSNGANSSASGLPRELVIAELETVLSSQYFVNSKRLGRFLRYVVEQTLKGNADVLKEYQLGLDVFDRSASYDPRTDPVVRVEARQLRFKLEDYYAGPGRNDDLVISVPKGGYKTYFKLREAQPSQQAVAEPSTSQTGLKASQVAWISLGSIILVLIFEFPDIARFVATRARNLESKASKAQALKPAAQDLYFKGRFYWNKRTPEDLNRAVDYFTQAIVRDPDYAEAYAGLADSYNLLREYSTMPASDAYQRAIAAAKRAIELNDRLAEAHCALAFATFYGAWDVAAAEREFSRSIELNPKYAQAHHWYATFLMSRGRFEKSLVEIDQARELDPVSTSILADKGLILAYQGRLEAAIELLKQIELSEPAFLSPHNYLAFIHLQRKDYPSYLLESRQAAQISRDKQELSIVTAGEKGYASGGARAMFQAMLDVEQKLHAQGLVPAYRVARTYTLLGNRQEALRYLNMASENRESWVLLALMIDPALEGLHDDSSYRELVARIGVPRTE